MPRPTARSSLTEAANGQFDKLWKMIDSMSDDEQNSAFGFGDGPDRKEAHWKRDRNLRDVLVHLHEWHLMVKRWYDEGTVKGGIPSVPGDGYTWKTLPELNQRIWEKYQDVPLASSKEMLRESHKMIMNVISSHTDDELFSKGVYKWTKSTTLGAYFISATSSHYEWAMNKIKMHIKALRN